MSDESSSDTYYDNFTLSVTPGILMEERHYYPYGLPIENLGSSNTFMAGNLLRYQGNAYRQELGLNWMDFNNRQYDPQLGRFLSVDAMADGGGQQQQSPYQAMGADPVLRIDPMGLQSVFTASALWNYGASPVGYMVEGKFITLANRGTGRSAAMNALIAQMDEGQQQAEQIMLYGIDAQRAFACLQQFYGGGDYYNNYGGNKFLPGGFIEKEGVNADGSIGKYTYVGDTKEYHNWLDILDLQSSGDDGWDVANTIMGAAGVGLGAQEHLMEYAVRSSFKSARTYSEFNVLRPTQQAWRYSRVLGNEGKAVLKGLKVGGNIMAGVSTAYSAVDAGSYYYNGGTDWQVGAKAGLDIIMTGVGFLGPIGFVVSSTYFILDASTNSFGGFGEH